MARKAAPEGDGSREFRGRVGTHVTDPESRTSGILEPVVGPERSETASAASATVRSGPFPAGAAERSTAGHDAVLLQFPAVEKVDVGRLHAGGQAHEVRARAHGLHI